MKEGTNERAEVLLVTVESENEIVNVNVRW
jgi:hypothetical protein